MESQLPSVPATTALSQAGDALSPGGPSVGAEHLGDGLAVPELLEDPAGQKGGDVGIPVGRREQEIT